MQALYINYTQRTRIGFIAGDAEGVQILKALAFAEMARCSMTGQFDDQTPFFLCGEAGTPDFSSQIEDQLLSRFPTLPRAEGSIIHLDQATSSEQPE